MVRVEGRCTMTITLCDERLETMDLAEIRADLIGLAYHRLTADLTPAEQARYAELCEQELALT
jgi:hypothetical protein